jgi:cytochrome c-type biogenesis protein CcmH
MSWLVGWLLIIFSVAAAVIFVLPQLRSLSAGARLGLQQGAGVLMMAAPVFFLVVGIGLVSSRAVTPHEFAGSRGSLSPSQGGPDAEAIARLKAYTHSIGHKDTGSAPDTGKMLPDVNIMVERLAARLESAPNDVKGWRMLGWSYFHMERFEEAAVAYAKALALDPNSAELKASLDQVNAKVAERDKTKLVSSDATPPGSQDALIRSMVDSLAARLESSPRDVEGWARLMRSRIVLGETEVAATALRRALEVFKDDSVARGRLMAAASELGLKTE